MLSRNYRLQSVGNLEWIAKHYNFYENSSYIDELIVLDVSREEKDPESFCNVLKKLKEECFIPMAVGGGIQTSSSAQRVFEAGADKIVINSAFVKNPEIINELANMYGQQSIIASVDFKRVDTSYCCYIANGLTKVEMNLKEYVNWIQTKFQIGEILLNSIDQDGTGQGFCLEVLKTLPTIKVPLILSGGAGLFDHFEKALEDELINAAGTANLFNFMGSSFKEIRSRLIENKKPLPSWDSNVRKAFKDYFLHR